jgi:DedD protein
VDDRLKERLTGAVILVAIVVVLVPEMFRGRMPADAESVAAAPNSAAEPPAPVRSFTLDATPPASESAPAAAVVPTAAEAAPPPAASAAAVAPAPPTAPTASAATRGWVVQVGSFNVREHAEQMAKQAAKAGLKVQVAGPDDKGYYRVRSAVLHDRAAALKLQAHYKELGYKSLINSAP